MGSDLWQPRWRHRIRFAFAATYAFKVLSGSLFQGKHAIACSMNIDRRYSKARACRHGAQCSGKATYCIFAHENSVVHPSDSVRRRSPRIGGAVDNVVVNDDIQSVLDNLGNIGNAIENHLGINLQYEISASDASHAIANENSGSFTARHEKGFSTPAASEMSLSSDGSEPSGDEDI